jgi:hypothetical protein
MLGAGAAVGAEVEDELTAFRPAKWPAGAAVRMPPGIDADPLRSLLEQRGLLAPLPPAMVSHGGDVVLAALNFLDAPYRLGGASPADGFDCSGFTRHVFATALGLSLPRRAEQQAHQSGWSSVPADALRPGDLVFFNTLQRTFSHVGIYLGDGRFIHAPRSGAAVRVERMQSTYWRTRYDGARRAVDAGTPPTADTG